VAPRVSDMFCNFCFVKNHKIFNNSTTTKASEKVSTDFESIKFWKFFDALKNNKNLLNKISHRFLMKTKLLTGWKSLIGRTLDTQLYDSTVM
jgi:hypothetical protein